MGRAISRRLRKQDHDILVWNRSLEKAKADNLPLASSPAELASNTDMLLICLRDSQAVEQVLTQQQGLLAAGLAGKTIIDFTTHDASQVLAFHEQFGKAGASYLETPIAGSVEQMTEGQVALLVSGEEGVFQQAKASLATLASAIFFVGEPGLASKIKLLNNLVLGGFMAVLAEAVLLGDGAGISRQQLLAILARGAGGSTVLSASSKAMLQDDYSGSFSAELMAKDLGYILQLAQQQQGKAPVSQLIKQLYEEVLDSGQGQADFSVLAKGKKKS